jgi:thiol-disulfide isomerase/thioredoxin
MEEGSQTKEKEEFWSYGRLALVALALFVIVVVASTGRRAPKPAAVGGRPAASKSAQPSASVMETAIVPLDGAPFRLADYRGKIVVLDLWATWCGPCRMEIPHLVKISEDYAGRGVEVIGLTVEDPRRDEAKVRSFARDFQINYKLGWAEDDWFLSMTGGNGSIPQTFVIDRDGQIRLHAPGYSPALPRLIREAIDKADKGQG